MTKAELKKLKKEELLALAKEKGLKGIASLGKEELIEKLAGAKKTESKKTESKKTEAKKGDTKKSKTPAKVTKPKLNDTSDTMKGESKKFEIEDRRAYMEPSYELVGEETYTLPQEYGDTKLTILVQDPHWMHAYWELNDKSRKKYGLERGKHHEKVLIRLYNVSNNSYTDIEVTEENRSWYFKVPEAAKSYYAEMGILGKDGKFKAIVRSNTVTVPTNKAADVYDEQWQLATEAQREEVFKRSGGYVIHKLVGSQSMAEWMVQPESMSSAGSGGSGSGGVAAKKPPQEKKRSFWAELHTELIVYGATEPDASVTVGGVPVKLSPNGTFSIRFYLKDGDHNVPFIATSRDEIDTIAITPFVSKHTERKEYKNK